MITKAVVGASPRPATYSMIAVLSFGRALMTAPASSGVPDRRRALTAPISVELSVCSAASRTISSSSILPRRRSASAKAAGARPPPASAPSTYATPTLGSRSCSRVPKTWRRRAWSSSEARQLSSESVAAVSRSSAAARLPRRAYTSASRASAT